MRRYIQQPGQLGVQGGTIGNAGYLAQMPPALDPQRLRQLRTREKLYQKGIDKGATPGERDAFLDPKRVGPLLPPMARMDGRQPTNLGQANDAFYEQQQREQLQALLEQQETQLNNGLYGGGQYGQADQFPATGAGFQAKYVS
jgi:hypothetical protein